MVFENITQSIATSITDPFTYWIFTAFIAVVMYLILKLFEIRYATLMSMVVPVLLLEFILRFAFGFFSVQLDFGTYALNIPFYDPIEITDGVMLMRFLDFTFNFGLFREIGLPILSEFMANAPVLPEPSLWFKAFVAFYVSVDSLIEFVFFYYVFSALLILIKGILKLDILNMRTYAAILASLPVLAYNYFISNPFFEYEKAIPGLQQLGYFFENAETIPLVVFGATLIISFLLVMEILANVIALFYETGSATFRPDWVQKRWDTNVQGVGFIYTLSFAIMYSMHQYAWYIFFPAMVIYSIFKKMAGGAVTIANSHQERQEMKEFMQNTHGGQTQVNNGVTKNTVSGSNLLIFGLVLLVIITGTMLAMDLNLI